mgnify:CR=1 FL=1
MRAWRAVAVRETASFFGSAMSPVVLTAFLLLTGLSWATSLLDYGQISRSALSSGQSVSAVLNLHDGVFQPTVASMAMILMLIMPAVTMRLFADEYRSRRSDLIFTWPVDDGLWVLGKWTAALFTALLVIVAAVPFLFVTGLLGRPEIGPLLASLLGLLLTAALAVAWGLVFSAAASHQLVAWLLGFGFAMFLQTVGQLEPHLPGLLGAWAQRLSLAAHLARFTQGVIDVRDVAYFVGGVALALTTATALITGRRLAGAGRAGRWLPVVALLVLTSLVQIVAEKAPLRVDLTVDGRRSLAPQTQQVLENLRDEVHVTAFYQRLDPNRTATERLLRAFADQAEGFTYEVLNPDRDLARVNELGVTTARTVVVQSAGRRRSILDPDEAALINAVFRAAEGSAPIVYYVLGHGEPALDDDERGGFRAAAQALRDQGYQLRPLPLGRQPLIPADASVVILASPKDELSVSEVAALHGFAARGGGVLALLDPGTPASLEAWCEVYNIDLGNDFVVSADETTRRLTGDRRVAALIDYPRHDITRGLTGMASFFPFAQSLSPLREGIVGLEARTILALGEDAWSEHDPLQVRDNDLRFDEGVDVRGPLAIAVALELERDMFFNEERLSALAGAQVDQAAGSVITEALRRVQESRRQGAIADNVFTRSATSRVVVVGDSDFAANAQLQLYGNKDLLLNMVGWLAREQVLVQARARSNLSQPLLLEDAVIRRIGTAAVAWPLLVGFGATFFVVLRRRR